MIQLSQAPVCSVYLSIPAVLERFRLECPEKLRGKFGSDARLGGILDMMPYVRGLVDGWVGIAIIIIVLGGTYGA